MLRCPSHLCCIACHQNRSCQCSSPSQALSGAVPRCCLHQENWKEPPGSWISEAETFSLCTWSLQRLEFFWYVYRYRYRYFPIQIGKYLTLQKILHSIIHDIMQWFLSDVEKEQRELLFYPWCVINKATDIKESRGIQKMAMVGSIDVRLHMTVASNPTPSQKDHWQSNSVSPSTGVWYTWKWSCSERTVRFGVPVSFLKHCWLSDCWFRLKREDVHVQKQWGSLKTASGSSYERHKKMFSVDFYDSSQLFFSPETFFPLPQSFVSAPFSKKPWLYFIFFHWTRVKKNHYRK